eukprot:959426_1
MHLSTLFIIVLASTAAIVSGATTATSNNKGGGLRRNLSGIGYSTCLDEHSCQAQAKRDGVVHFHTGDFPDYGCFSKNGKYFWGHGGSYEQQSDHALARVKKRVYCAEHSARGYDDDDDDWHGDEHHDDDDDWHGVGDNHYYYDTSEWRSGSHHSWSKSSKSTSWSSSGKSGKSGSGKSGKSGNKSSKSWWGHWDGDNWSGDGWLSHSKSSKSS